MSNTYNFLKKTTLVALCFIAILGCNKKPISISSGTLNLDKRAELIQIGTSNKNDVVNFLGESILKEVLNENKWAYFESIETRNFGKKKNTKKTILILEFDNRGILMTKQILNQKDFNKLIFDDTKTESLGLNSSFSKKIFSSIRKRAKNVLPNNNNKK